MIMVVCNEAMYSQMKDMPLGGSISGHHNHVLFWSHDIIFYDQSMLYFTAKACCLIDVCSTPLLKNSKAATGS